MRQAGSMTPREPLRLILVGFAYFAVAFLGLQLASVNPSATPIWPATGLAIAAILLWGYGIAPAIFIAAFIVNQFTTGSYFTSLAIAVGNTLEAAAAVYLIKLWADGNQVFDTPIGVGKFALIGLASHQRDNWSGSLVLANYAEANVVSVWLTWWLGDVAGALVVTPVLVLWARSGADNSSLCEIAATALTYLAAMAIGAIAFSPLIPQARVRDPLGFLSILPLLWAALRRGPRDTATEHSFLRRSLFGARSWVAARSLRNR
jgi:integral membrane sensor domain MASE1